MNTTPTPMQPAQTQNNNTQQLTMPVGSEQQITMPRPQEPSAWDKFKNWAENTGDAMQAASVGYATGATLGNFDEAMGAATAAVTFNPDNYTMGRDAVRQLQENLKNNYPNIYNGAEIAGVTHTNKYIPSSVMPVITGIGYANSLDNIPANIMQNAAVSRASKGMQKIPLFSQDVLNFGQNLASWYLLNQENETK